MTLKGKVIVVLAFLVALIASAGATVFGGLQARQGALDDIAADARALDTATLPFLIAAGNLKREADRVAPAPGSDPGEFDRHVGIVRGLARESHFDAALPLIDALARERRESSPQLGKTAGRLLALAQMQARDQAAALASGTASLHGANLTLKMLVLIFTGIGLAIAAYGAVRLYRSISDSIALVQRDIGALSKYSTSALDEEQGGMSSA
ncbi:MAG: hypothetical protein OEN55_11195 [Alphaproteobacteria bacterium]|nr:hypothetical protein [Alphaproteobacteria bacterium]